jgi:Rrf2 family protein
MRLSARTEYAAIAALELARHWQAEEPVRIREICAAQGVPARFLVHILLRLKHAGIVASVRGAAGGYRLARHPEEITLEDLRVAIEGPGTDVATTAALRNAEMVTAVLDGWADGAWAAAAAAPAARDCARETVTGGDSSAASATSPCPAPGGP